MDQSTLERTWAWVGQVDLFWTNIGRKQLTWVLTIVAKVYGIGFLVELAGLVRYYMQINGNFDLTVVFYLSCHTYNFKGNWLAQF